MPNVPLLLTQTWYRPQTSFLGTPSVGYSVCSLLTGSHPLGGGGGGGGGRDGGVGEGERGVGRKKKEGERGGEE